MRSYFLCIAMLAMGFGLGPSATAAADPPSRPQAPPTTANGGSNLTHHWIEDGGARMYWNTLNDPRQIRMSGARFSDPASVPPLTFDNSCCDDRRKGTGRGKAGRKAAPAKKASAAKPAVAQQAPAGVGANKLGKPQKPATTPPSGRAGGNVRAGAGGGGSGAKSSGAKGLVPTTYTNLETPKVTAPVSTPPVVAPIPQPSSPMPPLIPAPSSPSPVDAAGSPAPPASPSMPVMRVDGNS